MEILYFLTYGYSLKPGVTLPISERDETFRSPKSENEKSNSKYFHMVKITILNILKKILLGSFCIQNIKNQITRL